MSYSCFYHIFEQLYFIDLSCNSCRVIDTRLATPSLDSLMSRKLSLNWCAEDIVLDYDVTVTVVHKQDTELYRNRCDKIFVKTCNKNGYEIILVFRRMT
jgi:hypothetical protein